MTEDKAAGSEEKQQQHVLLFYKFHPLSKEREIVEMYRSALESLCDRANLRGRILVGCNEHQSEGINGTLSGSLESTQAFVLAMTKDQEKTLESPHKEAIKQFWEDCQQFYDKANCQPLVMEPVEFKHSSSNESQLFPDLNIKLVKELIGTGGELAPIPLEDVHKGYLTPSEWHQRIAQLKDGGEDSILIDCRNTKEWQIGHFPGALDPNTTTFNQFPTWVKQHSNSLANKKVLMYCTGGIRCEKASAYIRTQVPSVQEVRHLKGGIHKYLDQYGRSDDCLWRGKNFVFDGRGAHGAIASAEVPDEMANKDEIVGTCAYCSTPYDTFDAGSVCTVCRDPTLVCPSCRPKLREVHCLNHTHLRNCYFTDLSPFNRRELEGQLKELQALIEDIAVGKRYKQKRKTLTKQCEKISTRLAEVGEEDAPASHDDNGALKCRSCGEVGCLGNCWGFHGLKRKRVLDEQHGDKGHQQTTVGNKNSKRKNSKNNGHLQEKKAMERQKAAEDLIRLQLAAPASACRDPETGIRVPKPCTRILQTNTKGKWCGMALLEVLQAEFSELKDTVSLKKILESGLLRVNDTKVTSIEQAESLKLKNMDVISRVVHWNEPPVHIPSEKIGVQKVHLPAEVGKQHGFGSDDATIIVCDKPSTVPVHPAGPYLSNSMTIMVEAQEDLAPKSLIPCHRIDRVTSGLTLCCTDVKVARLVQARMDDGSVRKQYLAKVHGKFPSNSTETTSIPSNTDVAQWKWLEDNGMMQVNGPIETVDPANGVRKITAKGKPSQSLFQFLAHDAGTNMSMIACTPVTGRSHQLRVHLQWLGFSIVEDTQYGGESSGSDDAKCDLQYLTQRLEGERKAATEHLHSSSVTEDEVQAAIAAGPFSESSEGVVSAFTPAQLLQGGHKICLHAYRYQIPFYEPKSNKKSKSDEKARKEAKKVLAEVEVKVDVPKWAFAKEALTNLGFAQY